MKEFININDIPAEDFFIVTYLVKTYKPNTIENVATCIARGQSISNPHVHSIWETEEMLENHSARIIIENFNKQEGIVKIAFPIKNIDFSKDGVSGLLCIIMGGNLDIDIVERCSVINIEFPQWFEDLYSIKPSYGISGMRKYCNIYNKPLLGGIIKPKLGFTPHTLLDMVKEMVDNDINFIKEDELAMEGTGYATLEERLDILSNYLSDKSVIYCPSITCDNYNIMKRCKLIENKGINGVHFNWWTGFGAYRYLRETGSNLFVHMQSSGMSIFTNKNHNYNITLEVMCYLFRFLGIDSVHIGMIGGYQDNGVEFIKRCMTRLHENNIIPTLSCGFHPGLIDYVNETVGIDYMANVGGALHGHPGGTGAGVRAMRQAIDKDYGPEYEAAIEKWGKK